MKVNQCTRCGKPRGHFATGWSAERTFEFRDNGLCMPCRHVKRPSAQMHGGDLKALLTEMNKRKATGSRFVTPDEHAQLAEGTDGRIQV